MSGRPSQFGIDEEDLPDVLSKFDQFESLNLCGFHIYSGTNSLNEEAISQNFAIFITLFSRFSEMAQIEPKKLIFGSGFGIPYTEGDCPLDLQQLSQLINPQIDAFRSQTRFGSTQFVLEMGRYLVGPAGYFLTSVIGKKKSRDVEIRMCDGGMNNHLAACGLMGMVIRRNYPMQRLGEAPHDIQDYMLVGPLCTTIDTISSSVALPQLECGDVIAIASSGAYGFTCSPHQLISHPIPQEHVIEGNADDYQILT